MPRTAPRSIALLAAATFVAAAALAQSGTYALRQLTPESAAKATRAALDECRKRGYQVTVAVVDRGGVAQSLLRDRFAGPHTVHTAINKAYTAMSFRTDTLELAANTQPGSASSGIRQIPNVVAVGGGVGIARAERWSAQSAFRARPAARRMMPAPEPASLRSRTNSSSEALHAASPGARVASRADDTPSSASTLALLVAPPLFWAGNAVVARALVGVFPPLALSFARWALALADHAVHLARPARWWPSLRGRWAVIAISALGVGCYNSLQYLALQTSTAVNATLIGASAPAASLLVGAAFFGAVGRESVAGCGAIAARRAAGDRAGRSDNIARLHLDRGDLIMLVATLSWSVYTWLLRTRRPGLPAAPFLTLQIALGGLMILPFALLEYRITGATAAPTGGNFAALLMSRCCHHWSPISAGIAVWRAPGRSCRCTSST